MLNPPPQLFHLRRIKKGDNMIRKMVMAGVFAGALAPTVSLAGDPPPEHTFTGNVGLFSQYIFRGLTQTGAQRLFQIDKDDVLCNENGGIGTLTVASGDRFGSALAAGNFNGDLRNNRPVFDLVIGTPGDDVVRSGDLFGVPHGGKSFRIMAIDIQSIREGKMIQTYHLENWLSALGQLRAK